MSNGKNEEEKGKEGGIDKPTLRLATSRKVAATLRLVAGEFATAPPNANIQS